MRKGDICFGVLYINTLDVVKIKGLIPKTCTVYAGYTYIQFRKK